MWFVFETLLRRSSERPTQLGRMHDDVTGVRRLSVGARKQTESTEAAVSRVFVCVPSNVRT